MAAETVVILGGGVGGLVTANELRSFLRQDERVSFAKGRSIHGTKRNRG